MVLEKGQQQQQEKEQEEGEEGSVNYVLHAGRAVGTDYSGYLDFDPSRYEAILQAKIAALLPAFTPFLSPEAAAAGPEVFRSPARHHRLRIKLGVGVLPPPPPPPPPPPTAEGGGAAAGSRERLTYLMWDPEGRPVPVADFPIASRRINALMPRLLAALEAGPPVLRRGLRAVGFLDTLAEGDALVSLMYKVAIDDESGGTGGEEGSSWAAAARTWLRDGLGVQVVGRSRGVVIPLDRAYVLEALDISRPPPLSAGDEEAVAVPAAAAAAAAAAAVGEPGMVLRYKQVEGAFSNPNGHMAIHTLRWLCARANAILRGEEEASASASAGPRDLLELYCGNGNHTVALARKFRRVVGVEINKHLVQVARENLALNGIQEGVEAVIIQIPSQKFNPSRLATYRRRQGQRQGQQQQEGGGSQSQGREEEEEEEEGREPPFDFGCVLVDPPRAGLDRSTRTLVSRYDHVLYISCGPPSLLRDLRGEDPVVAAAGSSPEGRKHLALAPFGLGSTHEVVAMAVLDHFAYCAEHIEVAVHLRRRRKPPPPQQEGLEAGVAV